MTGSGRRINQDLQRDPVTGQYFGSPHAVVALTEARSRALDTLISACDGIVDINLPQLLAKTRERQVISTAHQRALDAGADFETARRLSKEGSARYTGRRSLANRFARLLGMRGPREQSQMIAAARADNHESAFSTEGLEGPGNAHQLVMSKLRTIAIWAGPKEIADVVTNYQVPPPLATFEESGRHPELRRSATFGEFAHYLDQVAERDTRVKRDAPLPLLTANEWHAVAEYVDAMARTLGDGSRHVRQSEQVEAEIVVSQDLLAQEPPHGRGGSDMPHF